MKKQKTLSALKKELWKWFALYIKIKYSSDNKNTRCFTCDAPLIIGTSNCQAGHYYTKKGYPALYFNENNVRPQCYHCNINLSGNTVIFGERLEKEIGAESMEHLKLIRHNSVKLMRSDYLDLIDYYKNQIINL
jgi:hypothetical protein